MIILAHTKTYEDCPNDCKGLSYLHDNQEEKTCGICSIKWNRINNEKVSFAVHCQCGCRIMNDELIKKFDKYYCPKCNRTNMNRPNKENIKVEYIKGVAEISSVTKQYSRQQDKYIDYLESKVLKLNKANVIKSVCKCGNELTEKEIFYETCLKCDRTV